MLILASMVAQRVKHLPAMQEIQVRSLGREDTLEEEMATHSSTLAWKIPWTEKPGAGYSPQGCKESHMTEWLHFSLSMLISSGFFIQNTLNIFWRKILLKACLLCLPVALLVSGQVQNVGYPKCLWTSGTISAITGSNVNPFLTVCWYLLSLFCVSKTSF